MDTTKEEALKFLNGYMAGKIDPESVEFYSAVEFVVDVLKSQSSLPSNLDEAAKTYGNEHIILPDEYNDGDIPYYEEATATVFKAGAEWIARQGENKEGVVIHNNDYIEFSDGSYIDLDPSLSSKLAFILKDGDKVITQIRKK